ncbi:hypothetical protein BH10PSE2_BH10PSE2_21840 [soil metagenome]
MAQGSLIALAVLGLAACTTPAPKAPTVVAQAEASQPIGSHMPDGEQDLCKARDLQWLVGRSKAEIPVPVDVVSRRVVCTSCAVTMDFSPYRLNIFFNEQTGVVEQVRCG